MPPARRGPEPRLHGRQSARPERADGRRARCAGGGVQPARDVDGDRAVGRKKRDGPGLRRPGFTADAGPEQGVDHHARRVDELVVGQQLAEPVRLRHQGDRHREAPGQEVARRHQTVPPVVAMSGHNQDGVATAGSGGEYPAGHLPPGDLHQLKDAQALGGRRPVEARLLLGGQLPILAPCLGSGPAHRSTTAIGVPARTPVRCAAEASRAASSRCPELFQNTPTPESISA